ncbi:MAG: SWIM zinc finger family protein [Isosphaeraceae bacterium]
MARSKSPKGRPGPEPNPKPKAKKPAATPASRWAALTWDDLDAWAGARSVERGRDYQRRGRVRDLSVAADGALLATVNGTMPYATTVALGPAKRGKQPSLESACSCPVGAFNCKHAVAVVAEYLQTLVDGRELPAADPDDPRWTLIEDARKGDDEEGDDWEDEDEAHWDDEDEDDWDDEDEYEEIRPARRPEASSSRPKAKQKQKGDAVDWDARIEQDIRARTHGELADLVWSLVRRYPELHQEFRERISLSAGNVREILAEARREIQRVTSEPAWSDNWGRGGYTPDYSKVTHRLERLLELGHADEVVSLGRDLLEKGLAQAEEANDEGEAAMALAECVPVVFRAVTRSSLPVPDRLIFAIDAVLEDGNDVLEDAPDVVLNAPARPEDWSKVADTLLARLEPDTTKGRDDFSSHYRRDRLSGWAARALEKAGRADEVRALYESEARATLSYERLVRHLQDLGLHDEAERRAREGIFATASKYAGIARNLSETVRDRAVKRKRWDVVAGHAAYDFFFNRPSASSFDELMKAAKKAGVEKPVREAALKFLETGSVPYRATFAEPSAVKPPAPRGRLRALPAERPEPPPAKKVTPAPGWPLPFPDYLVPMLRQPREDDAPRPHLDVLLDMALKAGDNDAALRWYDRMKSERKNSYSSYNFGFDRSYADRVAEAVSKTHPDRSIAIYTDALNAQLPHAQKSAYDAATAYLKKLRPLYEATGRAAEWSALVASIREKYRNRPLFMECLDRLDPRPIVQTTKPRRK